MRRRRVRAEGHLHRPARNHKGCPIRNDGRRSIVARGRPGEHAACWFGRCGTSASWSARRSASPRRAVEAAPTRARHRPHPSARRAPPRREAAATRPARAAKHARSSTRTRSRRSSAPRRSKRSTRTASAGPRRTASGRPTPTASSTCCRSHSSTVSSTTPRATSPAPRTSPTSATRASSTRATSRASRSSSSTANKTYFFLFSIAKTASPTQNDANAKSQQLLALIKRDLPRL